MTPGHYKIYTQTTKQMWLLYLSTLYYQRLLILYITGAFPNFLPSKPAEHSKNCSHISYVLIFDRVMYNTIVAGISLNNEWLDKTLIFKSSHLRTVLKNTPSVPGCKSPRVNIVQLWTGRTTSWFPGEASFFYWIVMCFCDWYSCFVAMWPMLWLARSILITTCFEMDSFPPILFALHHHQQEQQLWVSHASPKQNLYDLFV